METLVTSTRIVCDYCKADLGSGQWEHKSKCSLCEKDICLTHSATVYFDGEDKGLLVCREHLPKELFHIEE